MSYICKALEISELDVFKPQDTEIHLTNDEKEIIEIIRRLDELQYNRLLGYLRSLKDSTRKSDAERQNQHRIFFIYRPLFRGSFVVRENVSPTYPGRSFFIWLRVVKYKLFPYNLPPL